MRKVVLSLLTHAAVFTISLSACSTDDDKREQADQDDRQSDDGRFSTILYQEPDQDLTEEVVTDVENAIDALKNEKNCQVLAQALRSLEDRSDELARSRPVDEINGKPVNQNMDDDLERAFERATPRLRNVPSRTKTFNESWGYRYVDVDQCVVAEHFCRSCRPR